MGRRRPRTAQSKRPSAGGPPRSGGVSTAFALFAEATLTGVLVALASLPVVTAVPALAAGAAHLHRHLLGEPDTIGHLVRGFGPALRSLWPLGVLVPLALLVLQFNIRLAASGALPGGMVVAIASALLLLAIGVVTLRLVGRWDATVPWRAQLRFAATRTTSDPVGSLLLVAAMVMAVAIVWMLVPMLLIVGGLLALAALAVESRPAAQPHSG